MRQSPVPKPLSSDRFSRKNQVFNHHDVRIFYI